MAAIKELTSFDSNLVLSDTQTVSSTDVGKDTTPTAIELDLLNFIGDAMAFNISVTSVDDTTDDETYQIDIESSTVSGFGSNVITEGELVIDNGIADDTHLSRQFSPSQRYLRINIVVGGTTPSIVIDKAWITTAR